MISPRLRWRVFLVATALVAAPLPAQDGRALIDALIRKGILTTQEAEDIRADLGREQSAAPAEVRAANKSTDRLSVGMRMQVQYAHLETDVRDAPIGPVATDHAFLRRMYLMFRARLGENWGAVLTYDFVNQGYDDAVIEWRPTTELAFKFGLHKVNVGYEERTTSGNIKSIERSSITRYFADSNNGRRLGAASYHVGVFLDGRKELTSSLDFVYGAAVTNPERSDNFTVAGSSGDSTNNRPAFWANIGLTGKLPNKGTWNGGVGSGYLPDQGGAGVGNLGRGFNSRIYSAHLNIDAGRLGLLAEYFVTNVDRGASAAADARPRGFYVQPSLLLSETVEAVIRYAWLNSDHRGVTLSDVIRSAPGGGTMNMFNDWYAGANWYIRGNDVKFQLGAVYGKTRDTVNGAPAEAETVGVRSQMQLQF
jgi:hypothetical protein